MTVITFPSTYMALSAEKVVKSAGLEGKLIPVPRKISTSCGMALRLAEHQLDQVLALLDEAGVEIEGVYELADKER
ncbi:MAG: DUF3343 domain-containing protein [Firmicutes bacterium]|nr:DUF3343 domain-containing protein [Bacillota bacterium]